MKSVILLLLMPVLFSVNNSIAQNKQPQTIERIYNGNKFVLAPQDEKDTFFVWDPASKKELTKVVAGAYMPVSVNGKHVYNMSDVHVPAITPSMVIEEKILDNLKHTLHTAEMAEGSTVKLLLKHIVIDTDGQIEYSDFREVKTISGDKTQTNWDIEMALLFKNISGLPVATYKGHKVAYKRRVYLNNYAVLVKNHALSYHKI